MVLKKRTQINVATHFVGLIRASSEQWTCDGQESPPGYFNTISVEEPWSEVEIDGSDGRIVCYYGPTQTAASVTCSSHIKVREFPPVLAFNSPPEDLVATFYDAGTPARDATGAVVRDPDGRFTYDIPPAAAVSIRSSVEEVGSTRTYTCEVENFSSESRQFSLPQVTSSSWPSGWSGTVAAQATETMSFQVSGEDTYVQNCQATLSEGVLGGAFDLPIRVYVASSRLAYDGTVDIVQVGTQSNGANVLTFRNSGDAATKAVHLRYTGSQYVTEAVVEQALDPDTNYTIEDPDPPPGENEYRVAVGREPNGIYSEARPISN